MKLEDIDPDDLIGLVKYRSEWYCFAGTVAEWIMDYRSYDPWFDPSKSEVTFRNDILEVNSENVESFLNAMQRYLLSFEDITHLLARDGHDNWPLAVLVDFDKKEYVNGFSEIDLHHYIPSDWIGLEGEPLEYVPEDIRLIWKGKNK